MSYYIYLYILKNTLLLKKKINEYKIEIKFSFENLIFSIETMLLSPYIETAPKVGIDNKKEIFDASNLLNFNNYLQ